MPAQFATLADLKAYLGITKTTQDAFLQGLLDSHATIAENYTGRSFTPNPALVQAATTTVGVPTAAGVSAVTVASAAGIAAGQWLQLTTVAGATDTTQVAAVNGTTITVTGAIDHPHAVGDTAVALADTAVAVSLTVNANYKRSVPLPDAREIDTATLDGQALTTSGFQMVGGRNITAIGTAGYLIGAGTATELELTPTGPVTQGWLPTTGTKLVVTGRFGIWPIPADIKDAVLLMAARAYRERDASYGDAVQLADGGIVNYFRQMPPRARMILDTYRIEGVG